MSKLALHISSWFTVAKVRRQRTHKLSSALKKLDRRLLHVSFAYWHTSHLDSNDASLHDLSTIALDSSVSREQESLQAQVCKAHERLAQQSRMVITRMLNAQLALAFESFHDSVARLKRQRLVCERIIRRMKNVRVASAFATFHGNVCEVHQRRRKVIAVVQRWRSSILHNSFHKLIFYKEKSRQQMIAVIVLKKKRISKHNISIMEDSVDVWIQYVAEKRAEEHSKDQTQLQEHQKTLQTITCHEFVDECTHIIPTVNEVATDHFFLHFCIRFAVRYILM